MRTIGQTQQVIFINQDVPTYFYAVQPSRLPIITMLLGRGLSDTNKGEVNQLHHTKKCRNWRFVAHPKNSEGYTSLTGR